MSVLVQHLPYPGADLWWTPRVLESQVDSEVKNQSCVWCVLDVSRVFLTTPREVMSCVVADLYITAKFELCHELCHWQSSELCRTLHELCHSGEKKMGKKFGSRKKIFKKLLGSKKFEEI